jgi:REP element-mobilizing transposase RayT
MARPLRLEFAGALYHVTARGDGREDIYRAEGTRRLFLDVLGGVYRRFHWVVHAYCLMTNHYHLLVETPDANLSKGMRELNGVYTQRFNRTYDRAGHVFQGRYKAILVQKEAYLLELARYVVLNPVRARMVRAPGEWPWSSYRAMIGEVVALEVQALFDRLGEQLAVIDLNGLNPSLASTLTETDPVALRRMDPSGAHWMTAWGW